MILLKHASRRSNCADAMSEPERNKTRFEISPLTNSICTWILVLILVTYSVAFSFIFRSASNSMISSDAEAAVVTEDADSMAIPDGDIYALNAALDVPLSAADDVQNESGLAAMEAQEPTDAMTTMSWIGVDELRGAFEWIRQYLAETIAGRAKQFAELNASRAVSTTKAKAEKKERTSARKSRTRPRPLMHDRCDVLEVLPYMYSYSKVRSNQTAKNGVYACISSQSGGTSFWMSVYYAFRGVKFGAKTCKENGVQKPLHLLGAFISRKCGWEHIFRRVTKITNLKSQVMNFRELTQIFGFQKKEKRTKDTYAFAIVRDPVARLLSAYRSKVSCSNLGYSVDSDHDQHVKTLIFQSRSAMPHLPSMQKIVDIDRCSTAESPCCLRLEEFVETLLIIRQKVDIIDKYNSNRAGKGGNPTLPTLLLDANFDTQVSRCRFDVLDYDEIITLESLEDTSFLAINKRLGNAISATEDPYAKSAERSVIRPSFWEHRSQKRKSSPSSAQSTTSGTKKATIDATNLLTKIHRLLENDYQALGHEYNFIESKSEYISLIASILLHERTAPKTR